MPLWRRQDNPSAGAKRWLRTIAGGVVLGLIGVVAGTLLFPDGTPAILDGLDADFARAGAQLTARTLERFPAGTPEAKVAAALAEQGFTIAPASRTASWQRRGLPCTDIARIWWTAGRGRVTAIEGLRSALCP